MFKRLGVFGLMLVAATITTVEPAAAYAQERGPGYTYDRGQGYSHYDRDDHRRFGGDRDFRRDYEWREREAREHAWREHEWRERERWENRGSYNYAPGYSGNLYYSRPY